ncbi:3'-5' exonuclease [Stappia indica]|uniref:3'-5' exonuclease n=1 Tax=Stappia indica TaxID=538381 RepID=UPI000834C983|nr:3'-5' exonuclease [Stappia indica]
MNFLIADTFSAALAKLPVQDQKQVKITVFDLQQDPATPGLKFHRINKSKDPDFWSIRVNRDIRVIVHKTAASFLICYVDHHDGAYAWAERRRIEAHPRTGAAQIVEVRERVEEIAVPTYVADPTVTPATKAAVAPCSLFTALTADDLMSVGVPEDWIGDILASNEDDFLELAGHLPAEAAEALLDYVSSGHLQPSPVLQPAASFEHPDALRRFRVLDNVEELEQALEYPWDKWILYLHPAQREVAARDYAGPARVSGSAGTGKTVVALHRARRMLDEVPDARLLLTTFSQPLANALEHKLGMLVGDARKLARASVFSFQGVARDLFTLIHAHDPRPATADHIKATLRAALGRHEGVDFNERFLLSEWTNVVDAWQIADLDAYASVPRLGRKSRLGAKQRERLWPVFQTMRTLLQAQGRQTWQMIFSDVASHYAKRERKPFTHVIVDEAQDLGVPELRFLAAISEAGENRLFFSGDLGQRIFQEPFSWMKLGIDIRGRSSTLKVNYRTSHQIRATLDRLLPTAIRDVDGNEEDRSGTVSVFNGPAPDVVIAGSPEDETDAVHAWITERVAEGIEPEEIGIFVRSEAEVARARDVAKAAGLSVLELSERIEDRQGRVSIGTMHLAKGLEFKAVAVLACDDEILPSQERIESVGDESELQEVFDTERHLFYVACTRARDRLLVSGVEPGSEFLEDLR